MKVLVALILLLFLFIVIFLFIRDIKAKDSCRISNLNDVINLFPKTPQGIKTDSKLLINNLNGMVQNILNIPDDKRTFKNTVKAYDSIFEEYIPVYSAIYALESLSPKKEIRDAAQQEIIELNSFLVDHVTMNIDLYKAFKAYVTRGLEKESLNPEQEYFLNETMKDFKRQGFDLPKDEFEKVKSLKKELSVLGVKFDSNIAQHKCEVKVSKEELYGLDESFINHLQKAEDDKYILGCDYPTYFAIMDNCKVESTRKKLYLAFINRAFPENIELLHQIIAKRDQLAKILGFKSYAHLNLDDQMAKKPEIVEEFLSELIEKAKPKAQQEIGKFLKELPESVSLTENGKIKPWDMRYILSEYKKKHLDLDEEKLKEYFPMHHTVAKLLNIYEQFLGLKFKEKPLEGLWGNDLTVIEAYDAKTNKLLGYLILDLYPRTNKYSHAAHLNIVPSIKIGNQICPSVSIVMANFPKPTKDRPALLRYSDVKTFFHEFGHAMHSLLGRTELASFSGTNTKTDFVEMPSQMLEDWLKDEQILKMVSKHYETGKSIPDNMVDTIVELEKFDSGNMILRQSYLAKLALELFKEGEDKDSQVISKRIHEQLRPFLAWEPEDHFQASFGHLTGYGALYYGYLWSNVFAKDLFRTIKKHGLLDEKIGQKYAQTILSKGGSQDPNKLLIQFLGRSPSQKAFLEDLGLKVTS